MTQLEMAKEGIISPQMERVAKCESVAVEIIQKAVARGTIVIPANKKHSNLVACGIGQGLKTKVLKSENKRV